MVYLYAGLGVMMLSGIMAIFEMGLAVTGQSFFRDESRYYTEYLTSTNSSDDRLLIGAIQNGAWKTSLIAANPLFTPSCVNYPAPGNISWVNEPNSRCASFWDGRRILVDINSDEVVYICFPKTGESQCSFEVGP